MNCAQTNEYLDLLMDGELSEAQRSELEAHAGACPDCADALKHTLQLKALLGQMEPEADVPLATQAKWRDAVRREARQNRNRRLYRWIGSVAAAAVVLVGLGVATNLRGAPKQNADAMLFASEAPSQEVEESVEYEETVGETRALMAAPAYEAEAMADEDSAVLEADGGAIALEAAQAPAMGAAVAQRAPACELAIRVSDVDTACQRLLDLVQEYEGDADLQPLEDGGANLYVTLDAADAGDFMEAVALVDEAGEARVPELTEEGRVYVLLTVTSI